MNIVAYIKSLAICLLYFVQTNNNEDIKISEFPSQRASNAESVLWCHHQASWAENPGFTLQATGSSLCYHLLSQWSP